MPSRSVHREGIFVACEFGLNFADRSRATTKMDKLMRLPFYLSGWNCGLLCLQCSVKQLRRSSCFRSGLNSNAFPRSSASTNSCSAMPFSPVAARSVGSLPFRSVLQDRRASRQWSQAETSSPCEPSCQSCSACVADGPPNNGQLPNRLITQSRQHFTVDERLRIANLS